MRDERVLEIRPADSRLRAENAKRLPMAEVCRKPGHGLLPFVDPDRRAEFGDFEMPPRKEPARITPPVGRILTASSVTRTVEEA